MAKATEMLRSWECRRLHDGPGACLMFWEYENFEYLNLNDTSPNVTETGKVCCHEVKKTIKVIYGKSKIRAAEANADSDRTRECPRGITAAWR